jgi:hypothetical protein
MLQEYIQLDAVEILADRPFTDPVDSLQDVATLQYMIERLGQIMLQPGVVPEHPRPFVLFATEAEDRYHRMAISQLEPLLTSDHLYVVGFFGKRRLEADRGPVNGIDEELITEFPQHPHLLAYSTMQLPCGNSCNLVLFSKPQGLAHWAKSVTHTRAVALSPAYYSHIRLHNAMLPGGAKSYNQLTLLRTKYFDFSDDTTWAAIREL